MQDFFGQVMGYGPPKPRTAVKDFKVYPWRQLEMAVVKVMNWDRNPKRRYVVAAEPGDLAVNPVPTPVAYGRAPQLPEGRAPATTSPARPRSGGDDGDDPEELDLDASA